jgi:hypothetical protein
MWTAFIWLRIRSKRDLILTVYVRSRYKGRSRPTPYSFNGAEPSNSATIVLDIDVPKNSNNSI